MLKGHLTIEVFDKNGKLKQREEGYNIITNYSRDWMNVCWTNPLLRMINPIFNPAYASDINENFKGILLFKELCTEDKDNYFNQIMTKTVVGHADSLGVSADSSQYGILNDTASEITENSITRVWNFGQGKAVGTINSVALCNDNLGRKGTDDDAFINDADYKYFVDKNKNNVQQFNGGTLQIGTVENYKPEIGNATYTVKTFICIKNGIIYAYDYKFDNTAKKLTINIYKCDTSKYYKKQNFKNDFNTTVSRTNINFIVDNNSAFSTNTITYTTNIGGLIYPFCVYFNNKIYIIITNGNRVFLAFYDIATNAWTTSEERTNEKNASVSVGFAKNAQGIFVPSSDGKKIWRYTDNFVFMNEIKLPEKIAAYGNINIINNFNDDFTFLGLGSPYRKTCLTDFINYKCIERNNNNYKLTPEFSSLVCIDNNQITKNNINLSTIKNLMQPVIKGETDEMKVTYKIIKTNE